MPLLCVLSVVKMSDLMEDVSSKNISLSIRKSFRVC